jgi:hypothetical protein
MRMRIGVFEKGRNPLASAGRCGGGLGGHASRTRPEALIANGECVIVHRPSSTREGSVISSR